MSERELESYAGVMRTTHLMSSWIHMTQTRVKSIWG